MILSDGEIANIIGATYPRRPVGNGLIRGETPSY